MFSRPERLAKRTPKDGTDRYHYLRELVNEFTTTTVIGTVHFWFSITQSLQLLHFELMFADYQEQVLANLANFAYDPINYDFLRSLRVLDLFLDQLSVSNPKIVQFALAGLCNLASGSSIKRLYF